MQFARRQVIGAPGIEPARLGSGITGDTFLDMDTGMIRELCDCGDVAVDRVESGDTWR